MTDAEIIRRIAAHWIEMGGDGEGILWCWRKIKEEVERQLEGGE